MTIMAALRRNGGCLLRVRHGARRCFCDRCCLAHLPLDLLCKFVLGVSPWARRATLCIAAVFSVLLKQQVLLVLQMGQGQQLWIGLRTDTPKKQRIADTISNSSVTRTP